ncbi:MAG: hypothetical protein P8077_09405, partial [Gammaproteobacteria bacterium]
ASPSQDSRSQEWASHPDALPLSADTARLSVDHLYTDQQCLQAGEILFDWLMHDDDTSKRPALVGAERDRNMLDLQRIHEQEQKQKGDLKDERWIAAYARSLSAMLGSDPNERRNEQACRVLSTTDCYALPFVTEWVMALSHGLTFVAHDYSKGTAERLLKTCVLYQIQYGFLRPMEWRAVQSMASEQHYPLSNLRHIMLWEEPDVSVVAASFEMGASDLSGVQVSKLAMCAGIVGPVLRFETRRTPSTRYEPAYVASDVGIDLRAEDETIVPVGVVGTARIYSSRCSVLLSYRATAAIGALSGCFAVGVDGMVPVVSDKANDEASERATARQLCLDPAMELQFSGTLLRRQRGFRRWLLEPCFALSRAGHLLEGAHSARRLGRVLGEPTAFFPLLFSASSALKLYWTVVLWRDDCFDSNEWFEDALVRRQTVATVLERVRTMQRRVRRELPRHLWPELWVLAHRDTLSAWLDSLCMVQTKVVQTKVVQTKVVWVRAGSVPR